MNPCIIAACMCTYTRKVLSSCKCDVQMYHFNYMFSVCILGELNSETRMRDDKEKYYVLWMEVTMASQLRSFSANNTLTESVVLGKH